MYKRLFAVILTLSFLFLPQQATSAQDPAGPTYIVQAGDTLWGIASRFNVDLDELMVANDMEDGNLSIGQEIVIPGLEGVTGVLRTETVPYGDNLRSLMRRTQAPREILRRLNRLVSPTELYAGVSLIVPVDAEAPPMTGISLENGQTLLEEAVRQNSDIWSLSNFNQLASTSTALPGEILYMPAGDEVAQLNANGLPSAFESATVTDLPLVQGSTAVIKVRVRDAVTLSGSLTSDKEYPLNFFPYGENTFVALQGVHAMTEPGAYPLKLAATYADGHVASYEQMVLITSGNYQTGEIIPVPREYLEPTTTNKETNELLAIISEPSPVAMWNGRFTNPSVFEDCFTSPYGIRREYKDIDGSTDLNYLGFHSGLDFCGGAGLEITSTASGVVVMAKNTIVRGNATIIDHGWGVFSGYYHQSEIYVQEGQTVEPGQVIGLVGATGRVTGAHLHWEIWVNGVQVNPMDWLERSFP